MNQNLIVLRHCLQDVLDTIPRADIQWCASIAQQIYSQGVEVGPASITIIFSVCFTSLQFQMLPCSRSYWERNFSPKRSITSYTELEAELIFLPYWLPYTNESKRRERIYRTVRVINLLCQGALQFPVCSGEGRSIYRPCRFSGHFLMCPCPGRMENGKLQQPLVNKGSKVNKHTNLSG